ncbi:hypothetical protein QCE63_00585 [Caballeronia sp. LZ065]|uniref:hypothetical protein n=1 Tax=Caballeronia sp. LZ065 TaxID=3038571 RepID=UPI00285EC7B6|nr:hypothetical protein [Caballeronia sp. LZ065]MDR5777921.1 hypothetical protein [Caballeronia sp. LZ065]
MITARHRLISVSCGNAFSSSQDAASTVDDTGRARIPGIENALIKLQRPVPSIGTQTLKIPRSAWHRRSRFREQSGGGSLPDAAFCDRSRCLRTFRNRNVAAERIRHDADHLQPRAPRLALEGIFWAVRSAWYFGDSRGPLVDSNGVVMGTVSNGGLSVEYAAATCTVSASIQADSTLPKGNTSTNPANISTRDAASGSTTSRLGFTPQSPADTTQSSSSRLASILQALADAFSGMWSGS